MKNVSFFLIVLLLHFVGMQNAILQTVDSGTWNAKCFKSYQQQETPPDNWYTTDYDDSAWDEITGPLTDQFGEYNAYWCRQYIVLTAQDIAQGDMLLRISHDDEARVYVNGYLVYDCSYATSNASLWVSASYFTPGFNNISVYCYDSGAGDQYLDFRCYTNGNTDIPLEGFATWNVSEPKIVISAQKQTLYKIDQTVYNSKQLSARVLTPEGLGTQTVTWQSNDPEVVTVENGLVTAVSAGTASITASAVVDGKTISANCEVTVVAFEAGQKVVYVGEAGTLGTLLTKQEKDNVTRLVVLGEINNQDVAVLRYMAGRDENGGISDGQLSELDLSAVRLIPGGDSFMYGKDNWSSIESSSSIPSYMFCQCGSLTKIVLPNSANCIRWCAFRDCKYLSEIVIPEGYTTIESSVFTNCTSLSSIDLPSTLTSLGSNAFYQCTRLNTVNIPEDSKLNEIGSWCFYNTGLTSFALPAAVSSIRSDAFYYCQKLREFIIPEGSSLKEIESCAFQSCNKLSTFSIPEDSKLISIGESAFGGCPLTSFYAPKSLKSMMNPGFNTERFTTFTIHPENTYIYDIDGIIYGRLDQNIIYRPNNLSGTIRVPDFMKGISEYMYSDMSQVSTIVLPKSITYIDNRAFSGCWNLRTIISANTKAPVLDDYSFENIYKENITLYVPEAAVESYKSNGWDVFGKMESLSKEPAISLSSTALSFALTNAKPTSTHKLTVSILTEEGFYDGPITWESSNTDVATVSENGEVTAHGTGKAEITMSFTYNENAYSATCAVNVIDISNDPDAYYVEAGKLSELIPESEKYNITKLVLLGEINADDVRYLRDMAGVDNNGNKTDGKLAKLDLTNVSVVAGGSYYAPAYGNGTCEGNNLSNDAFSYCYSLEEIILPSCITVLNPGMLRDCPNLKVAVLPQGITEVLSWLFYGCTSLKSVDIPEGVRQINERVFDNSGLESINIPSAFIGSLYDFGLQNCNLKTIMVSEGNSTYKAVDNVVYRKSDNHMMLAPSKIETLVVPADVEVIEDRAFDNCNRVSTVICLGAKPAAYNGYAMDNYMTGATLIVPIGAKDAYAAANQWNQIRTVYEVGDEPVMILSDNSVMLYDVDAETSKQKQLSITVITKEGYSEAPITWSSEDETVATVTADGLVQFAGAGATNIIASVTIGEQVYTTSCKVTCVAPAEGETLVYVETAGTLDTLLTQEQQENLTQLTVVGNLNSNDIYVLRAMAGYDGNTITGYSLRELDLGGANLEGNYLYSSAFYRTTELRKITLPATIESIGSEAFYECSGLQTVVFTGDKLRCIGYNAFRHTGLKSIQLPDCVEYLEGWSFAENQSLTEVKLSEQSKLQQIGDYAFYNTPKMESFYVPASVQKIVYAAFCSSGIKQIEFAENSQLETIENSAFSSSALESIKLPESCTSLGEGVFRYCYQLESVELPSTIKTLNNEMFYDCNSLKSINLPASVRLLGSHTFYSCDNLTDVIFPVGTEIRSIGENAFRECWKLKNLFIMRQDPPVCNENAFNKDGILVYVPESAVDAYKESEYWKGFNFEYAVYDGVPRVQFANDNVLVAAGTLNDMSQTQLSVSIYDPFKTGTPEQITWTSADEEIATVDENGVVTAVGNGTTTITYSVVIAEQTYTAECTVNSKVFDASANAVYISQVGTLYQLLSDEQKNSLTNITLCGDLNWEDYNTLRYMSKLQTINVVDMDNHKSVDGVLYSKQDAGQFVLPRAYQGIYTTPEDMTRLPNYFFNGVNGVTGIVFGEKLANIGEYVFEAMNQEILQSVVIKNSVPVSVDDYTLGQMNSDAFPVIVPNGSYDAYKNTNWGRFSKLMEAVTETTFCLNQSEVALYQTTEESTGKAQLTYFAMTPEAIVTPTIQWRSMDDAVAAVTEEGAVVMTGAGTTKIIAKTTIEGKEYSAEVTVNCYAPSEGEQYVYVKEAGTLADIIPSSQLSKITNLVLFGQINSTDIQTLRYMAGRDESNEESDGVLKYLDMSQVKLVSGGESYRTLWGNNQYIYENHLGWATFAQCNALETVILPNSTTNTDGYVFYECQNLKKVQLPKSLTRVEHQIFCNCPKLESIVIPATVESMSSYVFQNCQNLREVTFEAGSRITNIDEYTFQNCRSLQKIEIPATVTTISSCVFENSGLTEIVIPENSQLTTIGTNAFNGTSLTSFYVSEKLRSISATRINNKSLKSVTAHADNANYKAVDGVLYSKTNNSIVMMPQGITGVFRTPDFMTSISTNSFKDCANLNSIVLGANVANIDINAFANNTSLNTLFCLNPEVVTANTGAFDGVDKEHVTVFVPVGMTDAYRTTAWNEFENIKEFSSEPQLLLATNKVTLYDTKIESTRSRQMDAMIVTAEGPSTAEVEWSVEDAEVATVSADGLIELVKRGNTKVTATCTYNELKLTAQCDVNVIGGGDGVDLLYVERAGTVGDLLSADDRARITDLVVLGNVNSSDLSVIGDMAKNYGGSLTTLDLSEVNLTDGRINGSTFWENKSLRKVSLPNNLQIIDSYAFYQTAIEEIVIPESVQRIEYYGFGECSNLKTVTLGDKIIFNSEAFGWNPSEHILQVNMTMSDVDKDMSDLFNRFDSRTSITYLKDGKEITSFDIPEGTKKIGAKRFYGCTSITSLTIPASVEQIGDRALEGIAEIHFLGTTPATLASSDGWSGMATYIVPAAALTAYRTAEKWSDFKAQIIPDNAVLALDLTVTAASDKSAVVAEAGGEDKVEYVTRLTLHGSINSYDIFAMRTKMPNLHYLDITDVNIVGNPYEYYTGCYTEDHRLGRRSFVDMTKLVEVRLPKTITEIGDAAFAGCTNLRVIEMHEGIETVSSNAFVACRAMKRFDFPDGIKSFGDYVFVGCTNLEEINFGKGLLTVGSQICYPWYWEEGRDWGGTLNKLHTVRFPESTEYIGSYAFYECYNLKNVVLPKALKQVQWETFSYCRSLEEITLPSGIRSIGRYAFRGCTGLKELRLPPMLETIEDFAFQDCDNIKDVYTYVVVPKDIAINQNTFTLKCYEQALLHVPDFSRYAYMWNTQWGQFAGQTEFSDTYDTFYAKNTLKLDNTTGGIEGTPDADIHETGGIEVSGNVQQELGEVDLNHNGTDGGSIIPENEGNISIKHLNVKISVEANRWYFFCFPFNVPLKDVKYGGEYVWRQYDGEARSRKQGGWRDLAAGTTELIAGRGYIFQGTSSSTLHLNIKEPEIKYGDASTDLETYVGADTQPADASWNFIGNPYTSYYEVTEDTYSAPITVWTGNGYEAYRPGDDDYEFAPYQAFFVQSGNGNGSVKFDADKRESKEKSEETKARAKANRAKKFVNPDRLLVNLELGIAGVEGCLDKTRVVFNDNVSSAYDANCDAAKFFSEERRAEIYTVGKDGVSYAINERPEDEGLVTLGFMANQKGKYTIAAQRTDVPVYLVDHVLDITHDLSLGEYEFSSAKGTFNKRFTLKMGISEPTSIDQLAQKIGMTYDIARGNLTVNGLNDNTRVALYNLAGQCVGSQQGNGTISSQPGAYIVTVGKLSAKIILK